MSRIYFENIVAPVSYLKMNSVSEFHVSQGLIIFASSFVPLVFLELCMLRRLVMVKMEYRSQTYSLNS